MLIIYLTIYYACYLTIDLSVEYSRFIPDCVVFALILFSQIKRKSSAGIVNNFDNNLTFRDLKAVVIFSLTKYGRDVYVLFKIIENVKSIKWVPDNLNILFIFFYFC